MDKIRKQVDDDSRTTARGRSRRPQQLFFVTCGRGMEPFVVKELSSNVPATTDAPSTGFFSNIESVHDGKVFFESSTVNVRWLRQQLFNLKSTERIFVCAAYYNSSTISCRAPADPAPAPRRGRAKSYEFADFVRRTCSDVLSDANCHWLESFSVWSRLQQPADMKVDNKNDDVNLKLRTDKMQNVSSESASGSDINCVELNSKRPRLEEHPESDRLRNDEAVHDNVAWATKQITFRLSSKSSGFVSRRCPHQALSRWIAGSIERHLPCWSSNLRIPDVEVYVHLNDEFLLIGFPLSRHPLSKRSYLNTIALRSTTCWAMSCVARLKPGDQILDPMCGAGTLIVEAAVCWGVEVAVGIDIDVRQLIASQRNVERSGVQNVVHLAQGMVQNLPFRNDSFDVVLCDYPFGRKYGTLAEAKHLLPKAVLEINRVCKNGGRVVFLLSLELDQLLTATVAELFDKEAVKTCISSGRPASKLVPRSVMAASSHSSTSAATTANYRVLGASTAASDWKRLSTDRLMLGNLEACIVAHIKRRGSVRH